MCRKNASIGAGGEKGSIVLGFGANFGPIRKSDVFHRIQVKSLFINIDPWSARWPKRWLRDFSGGTVEAPTGSQIEENFDITTTEARGDHTRQWAEVLADLFMESFIYLFFHSFIH